jgi:hypothetical protein
MADKKISALTSASTPLAGTEVLPIVQSGATVKVAVSDLTTGRAISATQITLTTGNVIVASGQGIDFSATPNTGTSELFADYEEGTWTVTDGSGASLTITNNGAARYTKIGRMVYLSCDITYPATASGADMLLSGLPYVTGVDGGASVGYTDYSPITQIFPQVTSGSQGVRLQTGGGSTLTNATVSTKRFQLTFMYSV